jgi:hypothetical protein
MSSKKGLKDMRDGQRRISRLSGFYFSAFIHMLFNRILAFYSIIYGVIMLYYLVFSGSAYLLAKVATAIFWVLITPQFFETVKGLSMSWSRGMVFGRLNDEYISLIRKRYGNSFKVTFYMMIPYVAILLWAIGFVFMVVFWR